jgi:hypothetical protein
MKTDPDMLDEYDFAGGVRGKYAALMREGTNLVSIDPDLMPDFPDSRAVNEALREVRQRRRRKVKAPSAKG